MNRVLPAIMTFTYMMFFTNASFAKWFNPEGRLEISFINNTDYDCKANTHLKHGEWDQEPPETLYKHLTTGWVVNQLHGHGPDLRVKFTCGGYSFSTRNQQNLSALAGGDQTLSVSDVDKHLTVTNKQIQHASWWNEKPGKAQIVVTPKGRHFGFE
ncbi:hypothetical protein [Candidatus Sororendozoicomonas aggregata]|uniref:hypothetical protein n=1 Tax=Candidatus Sororendozoicomonas aggregata TaxID=3073239 RepID=UPI002ED305A6